MKQRNLLGDVSSQAMTQKSDEWTLFVDGASRNNPGPSGAGIYIEKNDVLVIKEGYYLGIKTNNQAEYLALLLGLLIVSEHVSDGDAVHIISDSLLLVRQLTGVYKVKQPHLIPLHALCQQKMYQIKATIAHVLRHENTQADLMANYGVDSKQLPPKKYSTLLKQHDINL